jgi:hypothetical protein
VVCIFGVSSVVVWCVSAAGGVFRVLDLIHATGCKHPRLNNNDDNITVFCDVALLGLVDGYQRSWGIYSFHFVPKR